MDRPWVITTIGKGGESTSGFYVSLRLDRFSVIRVELNSCLWYQKKQNKTNTVGYKFLIIKKKKSLSDSETTGPISQHSISTEWH